VGKIIWQGEIMETTTFDILKLLVKTLKQAETCIKWYDLPEDYRLDATYIGEEYIKDWERILFGEKK